MSLLLDPQKHLEGVLSHFRVAPPDLLEARALQKRVDRKYIFPVGQLPSLIAALQDDYLIVRAGGRDLARYSSLYWDTEALDAYHDHRRGRRPRFKMRIRHHVDRGKSFLEIKRKDNRDQTIKARLERGFEDEALDEVGRDFVSAHSRFHADALRPTLWTNFSRITLVGREVEERITIDCNLCLETVDRSVRLPAVAVAEIKQPRLCHTTRSIYACRELRLTPMSASKYCLAVASLGLDDRIQAFTPALKAIRRYA